MPAERKINPQASIFININFQFIFQVTDNFKDNKNSEILNNATVISLHL